MGSLLLFVQSTTSLNITKYYGVTTESIVTKRFRESLLTSKLHVLQQGQEGLEIHLKVKYYQT